MAKKKKDAKKKVEEIVAKTRHKVMIGETLIPYRATAGTMLLKEEDGKAKASVYYTAYTKQGLKDPARRPITFAFNGGPGSSSVWLHLGALGPRRVQLDKDGDPLPPPGKLVDNDYSILDKTDLVFIDPVSTGYSRAAPGEKADPYHKFEGDIESVGEFIRLYTTRHKRWASKKFLAGESYGTTRAAGLSGYLQQHHGMYLNGIMLISAVLNFQSLAFDVGNDLPYVLFLPTFAATAWYHGKLESELGDLAQVLEQAESFARGEYANALFRGNALSSEERQTLAQKLARFTGLTPAYIERTDLRINIQRFVKELLRAQGRTVGRYDSRIKGRDRDAAGERPEYDPSYALVQGAYTAALNHYLRAELRFKSELPYEILTSRVRPWDYTKFQNQYVDVTDTLRQAITQNPDLQVFIANGHYDLATPYFATEYTFDHLGLPPKLQRNISMGYYQAGHMMYTDEPSLAKLKVDLDAFIDAVLG